MNCLICGSANLIPHSIPKISRQGQTCADCSFEFLWPQPTEKEIDDIYQNSYYKSWGVTEDENTLTAKLKRSTALWHLKKAAQHKDSGELLDIGCAFGYALDSAKTLSYGVNGVELSRFSSSIAQKKYGDKVKQGTIETAHFNDQTFDIVTMFDLIEHIPQPLPFMKEVRRVIKKDGIVAITTPDISTLSRALMGRGSWVHYKIEHLGYFNKKSIAALAKETGFELIEKSGAKKTLSFQYLYDQFHIFPHPLFTPLVNVLNVIVPSGLRHKTFGLYGGEMFVVLRAI